MRSEIALGQELPPLDIPPVGYHRSTPQMGNGWGDGEMGGDLHGNGVGGLESDIEEGY